MARLQTAVLCNAASVEASGLVSVLGAFVDTITGPALPVRQVLWFVARLFLDPQDLGVDQELEIVVESDSLDAGQQPVTEPLAHLTATMMAPGGGTNLDDRVTGGAPIVVPLPLEFPSTGLYRLTFSINGDQLWIAPLIIKLRGRAGGAVLQPCTATHGDAERDRAPDRAGASAPQRTASPRRPT